MTKYRPPRLLQPGDRLDDFLCASTEQTAWLRRHARQSGAAGTTRVFVVTSVGNDDARAFYTHLIPELAPSPTDPPHLVLLLKDARRTLRL